MRQMRLAKREVKDAAALRAIVEACQVVRIGAVDSEGMFIVPVNFGYEWRDCSCGCDMGADELEPSGASDAAGERGASVDGGREEGIATRPKLTLYVHSAAEGRKAEAFLRGCDVAIEMDCDGGSIKGDYSCAYSRAYRSVMGTGRISPVENAEEKVRALALIMEHAAPGAPCEFAKEAVNRVAIFRIDVDDFTGKERRPR